ncbi:MAG: hypothetical protein HY077_13025 [Elusimicrobia bacterium]|nr:hypothetical protein [Elusimicrobiota bacterium]
MSERAECVREPQPFRGSAPFIATAPPLSLPMRHFAFAAAAFWVFAAAYAWSAPRLLGFDFDPRWTLGLVHTLTLGWIAMTILGALTQMIPVHGQTTLHAPRVVGAAWWLFACGLVGFVGTLWSGSDLYWLPAAALAVAVSLYLYCLGRTFARSARFDWTAAHIGAGLGYLALLALLGLLLAYDRERGFIFSDPGGVLIAHIHLALIGWVSLTIFGASYRLVAAVGLSHLDSPAAGRWAFGLVNAGLLGLAADSVFLGHHRLGFWGCVLALGFLCYAWQARSLLKGGSRDPSFGFVLLAIFGGFVWTALGLSLAFGWIEDTTNARAAYIWTALLGWVTPWIMGQVHKIAPFLVWLHVYSPRNWKPPVRVPKIEDLTSRRLAWLELALLTPAIYSGIGGFLLESPVLLRLSGPLLFGCASVFVENTAATLSHLMRRDARWSIPEETARP